MNWKPGSSEQRIRYGSPTIGKYGGRVFAESRRSFDLHSTSLVLRAVADKNNELYKALCKSNKQPVDIIYPVVAYSLTKRDI